MEMVIYNRIASERIIKCEAIEQTGEIEKF